MMRRLKPISWMLLLLPVLYACNRNAPEPFEFHNEVTLLDLQHAMEARLLSSEQIVTYYLGRIEQENARLNAIISVNPDALDQARALDIERDEGVVHGPLHGIPVILKDNINTADPMPTTAGSLALQQNFASGDAALVRRLRDAGAVILAKANLSEWANFRSTRSISGWSAVGGQTNNPYDITRNPCGSSSGSAVAVAANLAPLAVGTETDGSIVCPASVNGVVGIKPSLGVVSRSGIVPLAHSQDTAGPIARTVTDAVLLLDAMAGVDPEDELTLAFDRPGRRPYSRSLEFHGVHGKRIGVLRELTGFHPQATELIDQAIDALSQLGAVIVDPVENSASAEIRAYEFPVLLHEFKADLNAYLATTPPAVETRSLAALIRFNQDHATEEMPWFGQEIFLMAEQTDGLENPGYLQALAASKRLARTEGIDALLKEYQLDAIIAQTKAPAWKTDPVNSNRRLPGSSRLAAVAGYPSITVPMGYIHGLPVGMSIFGGHLSEETLIRIAYAYEQATRHRRAPEPAAE